MSAECEICHGFKYSFGGVRAAQYLCDYALWEMVLNSNQHLTSVVELGTWQGGFSWFLWAQTQARGMSFYTFDVVIPDKEPPGFERIDVYLNASQLGARFAEMGPIALFCDGGNKPRELRTFPPYLDKGSVVLVHDWGSETLPTDVPDFLEEIHGDVCDDLGSITRIFAIKGDTDAA